VKSANASCSQQKQKDIAMHPFGLASLCLLGAILSARVGFATKSADLYASAA
jgi:hypothetical protein